MTAPSARAMSTLYSPVAGQGPVGRRVSHLADTGSRRGVCSARGNQRARSTSPQLSLSPLSLRPDHTTRRDLNYSQVHWANGSCALFTVESCHCHSTVQKCVGFLYSSHFKSFFILKYFLITLRIIIIIIIYIRILVNTSSQEKKFKYLLLKLNVTEMRVSVL